MCPNLNIYVVCYGANVYSNKFYFLSGTEHKHFVLYPFCHFSQTRAWQAYLPCLLRRYHFLLMVSVSENMNSEQQALSLERQ